MTATEASRRFADLHDGVEQRRERYTIVRFGRVIAQLQPAVATSGAQTKGLLRRHRVDRGWSDELCEAVEATPFASSPNRSTHAQTLTRRRSHSLSPRNAVTPFPFALAQLHADAGTPVDTLNELQRRSAGRGGNVS